MTELDGDIWDFYPADGFVLCIPTNGSLDSAGLAVMGAGLALQAKQRIPGIAADLGYKIRKYGNDVHSLDDGRLRAFPTKESWRDSAASPELIKESGWKICMEALGSPETVYVLPRVGCGAGTGNLHWEKVKPLLDGAPDNVCVVNGKHV